MVIQGANRTDASVLLGTGPFAFVDVEFTTLDERHRRPWEIAVIRHAQGHTQEHCWLISDVDLTGADSDALDVGGLHEPHPLRNPRAPTTRTLVLSEGRVATQVAEPLADAQWVGAVPDADALTITGMLRRYGLVGSRANTPLRVCWPNATHHPCPRAPGKI